MRPERRHELQVLASGWALFGAAEHFETNEKPVLTFRFGP